MTWDRAFEDVTSIVIIVRSLLLAPNDVYEESGRDAPDVWQEQLFYSRNTRKSRKVAGFTNVFTCVWVMRQERLLTVIFQVVVQILL